MSNDKSDFKKHWLRLTRTCNNRCSFCHDSVELNGTMAPFDEVKNNIDTGREDGAKTIVLSGGEPTIHRDFIKALDYSKKAGYEWVQTITNGRMFGYQGFVRESVAAGLNEATFSINAHTPELFDEITGVKGSFGQTYQGLINALNTKGLVVSVDIVVSKINMLYIPEIIRKLFNLGVREFELMHPMPFGRAWDNRDKILISRSEADETISKICQKDFVKSSTIWMSRFPESIFEGNEHFIQAPEKIVGDVFSHADYFNNFLSADIPIHCFGERCNYCFLKHFCDRLKTLKNDNRMGKAQQYIVDQETICDIESIPPETISRLVCNDLKVFEKIMPFATKNMIPVTIVFSRIPDPSEMPDHNDVQICILLNPKTVEILSTKNGLPVYSSDVFFSIDNCAETLSILKNNVFPKRGLREWINALPAPIANLPPCARDGSEYLRLDAIPINVYNKDTGWRLDIIVDHFLIRERYCKPSHCVKCRINTECKGIHLNIAKIFGFRISSGPLK